MIFSMIASRLLMLEQKEDSAAGSREYSEVRICMLFPLVGLSKFHPALIWSSALFCTTGKHICSFVGEIYESKTGI